jgi:hypothetical protein
LLQQPDDDQHHLLGFALLLRLVIGEEVEMRDANRYDEVNSDRAVEARSDLVAESSGAATGVGDDEQPAVRVGGGGGLGGGLEESRAEVDGGVDAPAQPRALPRGAQLGG